jgi:hypothetical protein
MADESKDKDTVAEEKQAEVNIEMEAAANEGECWLREGENVFISRERPLLFHHSRWRVFVTPADFVTIKCTGLGRDAEFALVQVSLIISDCMRIRVI